MNLYGKTDRGKRRVDNQDIFSIHQFAEDSGIAVVCDGMGGENAGQLASYLANQQINQVVLAHYHPDFTMEECQALLVRALSEANQLVYDTARTRKELFGMGTTSVVVLVHHHHAYVAHVGDSRVYALQFHQLVQLTTDHSVMQQLLDRGKITPEQIATHPDRSKITRAIGAAPGVDIDIIDFGSIENTPLLLCSDGLTNCCSDEQIEQLLLTTKAPFVCNALVKAANVAGGIDNITAAYITNQEE